MTPKCHFPLTPRGSTVSGKQKYEVAGCPVILFDESKPSGTLGGSYRLEADLSLDQ